MRSARRLGWPVQVALVLIVLSGLLTQLFARGKPQEPGIVSPDAKYDGKTYDEWADRWWQWAFSMPVSESPLFHQGSEATGNGQSGNVWFLCGVFGLEGEWAWGDPVVREITVPEGKALFFPVLNNEGSLVEYPWCETVEDLYEYNADGLQNINSMYVTIDYVELDTADLLDFRATSPRPFAIHLPKGDPGQMTQDPPPTISEDNRNLLQYWNIDVAGKVFPVVGDGYYVLVEPLPVGEHVITFGGNWDGFIMDITYHVTVVPHGRRR